MGQQVERAERKPNPSAVQADASAARAQEQVAAEQLAEVAENRRIASGVETVASVIHADAFQKETAGQSSHGVGLLEYRDRRNFPPRQLQSGAQAGGTGPENHHTRAHRLPLPEAHQ